jgi:hypothetical protein
VDDTTAPAASIPPTATATPLFRLRFPDCDGHRTFALIDYPAALELLAQLEMCVGGEEV